MSAPDDPHKNSLTVQAGPDPVRARATLILLHGRGASAEGMVNLYEALHMDDVAALAPEAFENSWYPHSFLAPLPMNQPHLDSALQRVEKLVQELLGQGITSNKIALLGFSQGACLACEFVARNPRRYGAIMALTGGLIGPPGVARNYAGSLAGTPVFLGTSDPDIHVPFARVQETKGVLDGMGAETTLRRYPGMPHTINDDELSVCRTLLQEL